MRAPSSLLKFIKINTIGPCLEVIWGEMDEYDWGRRHHPGCSVEWITVRLSKSKEPQWATITPTANQTRQVLEEGRRKQRYYGNKSENSSVFTLPWRKKDYRIALIIIYILKCSPSSSHKSTVKCAMHVSHSLHLLFNLISSSITSIHFLYMFMAMKNNLLQRGKELHIIVRSLKRVQSWCWKQQQSGR